jgi:perosamine synthetase
MISIYNLNIDKYKESAIKAIHSGWISNHGEYIIKTTELIKKILNINYCILMANGTCATHCLFLSLKYKYPSINNIYIPNNCYIAVYNSALLVYNAEQLNVLKIDIDTWNMSIDTEYILSLKKNSAIVIVHNMGNIININFIKKIRPDIILIEDNCEGLFGKYNNIYTGTDTSTLCSSISFYGNKIITSGEGGAFLTNDIEVYTHINKVYSQGMSDIKYIHNVLAYNYRMNNISAALLYDQLLDINNIIDIKKKIFNNYTNLLYPLIKDNKIKLFKKEYNIESALWIFSLRVLNNNISIENTVLWFKNNNIDIRPFFYPINRHNHLNMIKYTDDNSNILNNEIIMIPSSPNISLFEQNKVIDVLYEYILFINNISTIYIDNTNIELLNNFIKNIDTKYFTYYINRTSECIKYHKYTLLFYDNKKKEYVGYTHINNDNWFGIYLNKNYQNKKLGSLLLNFTIQISKINILYLSVNITNEIAIKLYKKNDFIIYDSCSKNYYMKKNIIQIC